MTNDLLFALSAKIERLYNRMISSEVNLSKENVSIKNDINNLREEISKTNEILLKIYEEIRKK